MRRQQQVLWVLDEGGVVYINNVNKRNWAEGIRHQVSFFFSHLYLTFYIFLGTDDGRRVMNDSQGCANDTQRRVSKDIPTKSDETVKKVNLQEQSEAKDQKRASGPKRRASVVWAVCFLNWISAN